MKLFTASDLNKDLNKIHHFYSALIQAVFICSKSTTETVSNKDTNQNNVRWSFLRKCFTDESPLENTHKTKHVQVKAENVSAKQATSV